MFVVLFVMVRRMMIVMVMVIMLMPVVMSMGVIRRLVSHGGTIPSAPRELRRRNPRTLDPRGVKLCPLEREAPQRLAKLRDR